MTRCFLIDRRFPLARRALLPFVLLLAVPAALAEDAKVGDLTIGHAYSRPSAARNGAAYMTIESKGATDRLVAAATARAGKVELHTVIQEGDVMRMRQVPAIEVPAGGKVELKPGGFHVMLLGLTAPLKEGERYQLTLEFAHAGKVEVDVQVEKPGAGESHPHHGHSPAKKP